MKLLSYVYALSMFISTYSFDIYNTIQKTLVNIKPIRKISKFITITRAQNIPSVLALSFTGGYIMNPNILHYKPYWISAIESTFIMMNSMVINDIIDLEVDRINSPNRSLVTGVIKKKDAILLSLYLSCLTEFINFCYLPRNLQWIIHTSILYIHLYTPIFKRIFFIKNISCAGLVAFSVFFSGLSSSTIPFLENKNRYLLYILTNMIFGGSWVNEILLDIRDKKGDSKEHISTIATVWGNTSAWTIAFLILYINILMNTIGLLHQKINPFAYITLVVSQQYVLHDIPFNDFSIDSIQRYLQYTTKILFILLLYFCIKRG